MVGKPNFPPDVEGRADVRGAAAPTPGLSALDQERQASLADEGGWAGAVMESQDESGLGKPGPIRSPSASPRGLGLILAAAGLLLGAFLIRWRRS